MLLRLACPFYQPYEFLVDFATVSFLGWFALRVGGNEMLGNTQKVAQIYELIYLHLSRRANLFGNDMRLLLHGARPKNTTCCILNRT